MPRHLWTIICEKATIDRDTNNISLIEIIEGISVGVEAQQDLNKPLASTIVLPVTWTVVSTYVRDDLTTVEKAEGELRLISPSGQTMATSPFEIDLTQFVRMHCLMKFVGWPVSEPGHQLLKVAVKSTEGKQIQTVEVPLEVRFTLKR